MIPSSPSPETGARSQRQGSIIPPKLPGAEVAADPARHAAGQAAVLPEMAMTNTSRRESAGDASHRIHEGEEIPQSSPNAGSSASPESLESRVASGDPHACMQFACRLMRGRGVERNFERAVELFDIAARAGDIDALYRLGKCYLRGIGCAKDPAGAASCFERAAGCGHAAAAFKLGNIFEEGIGAPRSSELAAYWYRRAAYLGEPRAYDALLHLARRPRPRRPGR